MSFRNAWRHACNVDACKQNFFVEKWRYLCILLYYFNNEDVPNWFAYSGFLPLILRKRFQIIAKQLLDILAPPSAQPCTSSTPLMPTQPHNYRDDKMM